MQQPPRPRKEGIFSGGLWGKLITRGVLIAAVTVALFAFSLAGGDNLERAQTIAFATLITTQLTYVFDCRVEGRPFWAGAGKPNWYLNGAVASSCLLMLLVIYHPLLRPLFYTANLSAADWALIAAAGLLPSVADGINWLIKGVAASILQKKVKIR